MTINYSLGSSTEERKRLLSQVNLYGDLRDITFSTTATVCEIGCGPGSNLWIAQQTAKGKYIGVDIDKNQIESATSAARELGLTNTEFHLIDGKSLPVPDQFADSSFTRCVLIHQPDPQILAKEMYRIIKPGGKMMAIEPHDPTYYFSPSYKTFLKCYRAKTSYAYGNGKGSPDIALNLYPLFKSLGLKDISIRPHIIASFGKENIERSRALLNNLFHQVEALSEALISNKLIVQEDLRLADSRSAAGKLQYVYLSKSLDSRRN